MTNEERDKTIEQIERIQKNLGSIGETVDYLDFAIDALEQQSCEDKGEISDGYHTFNQLYHQRAILFATIVNQNKNKAWKSFKHSDGTYCFDSDGEWFIVGVDTPQGSYTYHYSKEYWDMFDCQELEYGKEWDGHTEEDVTRLLSLEQQPNRCDSCIYYEEQDGSNCYECIKGMADNFEEQPTDKVKCNHTTEEIAKSFIEDVEAVKDQLDGQPMDADCISRSELLRHQHIIYDDDGEDYRAVYVKDIKAMPSVTPKRPKGKWIGSNGVNYTYPNSFTICSVCKCHSDKFYKYCPNCGAEMSEVTQNENDS